MICILDCERIAFYFLDFCENDSLIRCCFGCIAQTISL